MKMMKMLFLMFVLVAAGSLVACSQDSSQEASSEPVEVSVLYWPGPESEAMQKVIDQYNSDQGKGDGVIAKMIPAPREGFWEKESAMMGSDNTDVDIYMTASYKIGEHKNDLLPLDEELGDAFNVYIETTIDSLKNEGKTYALPTDVSNHFMYYRKDLVDKLLSDTAWQAKFKEISKEVLGKELSPKDPAEWTWEDFIAASAFFTKKYNPDSPTKYGTALPAKNLIYNVMIWNNVLYSYGGDWFDENGNADFDTPEVRKSLKVYADIIGKELSPASSTTYEYPETNQAFQTEQAAFVLQWSAAYNELTDENKSPQVYDKVGIAPSPGEEHATHVHALGIGVNKHSKNTEATLKFMRYVASADAMQVYANNGGIPPITEVLNNLADKRPEFPYIAEHVDKYGYVEDTSENVFPILNILAEHFSGVWAGQTDIDEAAKTAQEKVAELLGE